MQFRRVRGALVWLGAGALVMGTAGALNASPALAAAATIGRTSVADIGTDTATLSASVNPNGTSTAVSATCTGGPFQASTTTATGSTPATQAVTLTGLTGFGKYVCWMTATQASVAPVESQDKAAFFTTAAPTPVTLYVDGNPEDGGTKTAGCTGPGAEACKTIQQAVDAAQALTDRAVTIRVQGLAGPEAAYSEAVTIALPETVRLTIRGVDNPVVRGLAGKSVFTVAGPTGVSGSAARVRIDGLTITGGEATGNAGGGVTVAGDLVWLVNNTITGNRGSTGAGIYNSSTNQVTLVNNTITDNAGGAGSSLGVAVFTQQGSTLLINNTLADNPPSGSGTGLDAGAQGYYRLMNSILLATTCANPKPGTDGGYNVESGNTCGLNADTNRVTNTSIHLADTLAANGSTGPRTLAIAPESAAHDWVPVAACTVTFDARGLPRPGIPGQNCDAGAFEIQAPAAVPTVGATTASAVTDTTATLAAMVNPGGATTDMSVVCAGGPYAWTSISPGSGRSPVNATADLTELKPGTAYTCTLSATNSAGTAKSGSPTQFTTAPAGSTPSPTPTPASTPTPTPSSTPAPTPAPTPTATPAPAPKLTITAKSFKAKKGKTTTYTVATFTDRADLPASSYRVTITWGDGTRSKGTVTRTGVGTYKVTGKHKYKTAGKKATKVSVTKPGTAAVTATGRATSR